MKYLIISVFVLSFTLLALFVILSGYNSAFEADQACHYSLMEKYPESNSAGCDHDTETRQWLLYEKTLDNQPAKVIDRFRY